MSEEMVVTESSDSADSAASSNLLRSISVREENREPNVVYPACLEFQSHGTCPWDMSCVVLDSATSALPTRPTWILPRGVRLRIFSTVLSGYVSMNTDEIVEKLSKLFEEYATDPENRLHTPEEYEVKIGAFQTEIQRLLLTEVPDDIANQIRQNAKIIKETTRGVKRESAVETFRDLVNYADLLLKDSQFIASYTIYDGDIDGHNMVPLKIFTRGELEYKAIDLEKAPTNWTISWFQGSPIQTYTKPHPPNFLGPKRNEDGSINHLNKSVWNATREEHENTNQEIIEGLIRRGYTVFDILDNTCQTPIDKITGLEIVRQSLFDRIRKAEKLKIQDMKLINDEYVTQTNILLSKYANSDRKQKDLDKLTIGKKNALEEKKKRNSKVKAEIDEMLDLKKKILPKIYELKKGIADQCKIRDKETPFPEGGKKTRRIGLKMTVKKNIRSTMKKTRNKKMKRLNKGRKGRKGRKTKKTLL